ncbi:MAG: hypothetical protein RPT95_13630 [Candidatus Sedimenticola sp. (ex Thyasira tokunagai)]
MDIDFEITLLEGLLQDACDTGDELEVEFLTDEIHSLQFTRGDFDE